MEGFLSVHEISSATGFSRSFIQKRAAEESWPYVKVRGRGRGGKKRKFEFKRLPYDIQVTILGGQKEGQLPAVCAGTDLIISNKDDGLPIPFSDGDPVYKAWIEKPENCREAGRQRLNFVNKIRRFRSQIKTKKGQGRQLKRYASSLGVGVATLYRYEMVANKALKIAQRDGGNIVMAQIVALTPDYGGNKDQCRAFSREAIDFALSLYCGQEFLNLSDVYRHVTNEGQIRGWRVGSFDTLRRTVGKKVDNGVKVLSRKGFRRYEADCELKILRNYREIWPNFMWVGDHHIFDVFVRAPGGKILRPWLTAWMDMRSRSFMGWCISFQPNSDTIAYSLAHGIWKKDDSNFPQHGSPWSVYVDNGKDYRSQYLNGEKVDLGKIDYPTIIEKYAALGIDPFYIDLAFDPVAGVWVKKRGTLNHTVKNIRIGGVYGRLNIHSRYAKVYHPWGKPIERCFRNVVQSFSRELPGWCGSGHDQRPEKLSFEIKRGLILDFEEFCNRWYQWVIYKYHKTPQSGHGMDGLSPNEVFLSFGKPLYVDPELLSFALLRKDQVRIYNWGFKLMGREFELDVSSDLSGAAVLNKLINRFATVLYDPDLKIIRVYFDGKYICGGKSLCRASFVRPDDPVMVEKLRLQAFQRQLNKGSLKRIREQAPLSIGSNEQALLELSAGDGEFFIDKPAVVQKTEAKSEGPIYLTEEERYRAILRLEARGVEVSVNDQKWRAKFECGDTYLRRKDLFATELDYMKFEAKRGA